MVFKLSDLSFPSLLSATASTLTVKGQPKSSLPS
jgi:hypothetical protein